MHKIKPSTLTARIVKNNFKRTIERFVASDNTFSFMSSIKGKSTYWKQFLYGALAMINQLGIPTCFPTLLCVDLGSYPVNIYLFNADNGNTRKSCEICSKLTIKNTRTTSITSFHCFYC